MTDDQVKIILDKFVHNAASALARRDETGKTMNARGTVANWERVMAECDRANAEAAVWYRAADILRRAAGLAKNPFQLLKEAGAGKYFDDTSVDEFMKWVRGSEEEEQTEGGKA